MKCYSHHRTARLMKLENQIVYGPVQSRRFGWDFGINLLPSEQKICSYDCVYCQYGHTPAFRNSRFHFPSASDVIRAWDEKLRSAEARGLIIRHSTISGNGEPTMHPYFARIMEDLIAWRNANHPRMRLALLSTGYRAGNARIRNAMELVDELVVKFDAGNVAMWNRLDRPLVPLSFSRLIQNLKKFRKLILQCMFVKGWNDSKGEIRTWQQRIKEIRPKAVQIYTISRIPAISSLQAVDDDFLRQTAIETQSIVGVPVLPYLASS